MTKRLLLISPYFPPLKAIGSKRAVNIAQGLTALGWKVDVLCTKAFFERENTPYQFELPDGVTVNRGFISKSLRPIVTFFKSDAKPSTKERIDFSVPKPGKPGVSLTPFDQYLWDVSGAVKSGKKMIRSTRPDVILVNADPWSGLLVGQKLSRWSGIPWVADFRDPWTAFDEKLAMRPKPVQKIIRYYERKFFESAASVIFNTELALKAYCKLYPEGIKGINNKFTYIRNAYNPSLMNPASMERGTGKLFVFGYFGSFREFVSPKSLLEGFSDFVSSGSFTPQEVTFQLTGRANDEFYYYVDQLGLSEYVNVNPSVAYEDSLKILRQWNVLLLVVDLTYRLMVPAKLYDYLYARRPILALSGNDEVNSIIENTSSGNFVSNHDVESIAELFKKMYRNHQGSALLDNESQIESYGVKTQSEKFNEVLSNVIRVDEK